MSVLACFTGISSSLASELSDSISEDYQQHLAGLFDHFHRNPELSFMEVKTAARMAQELRAAGFTVTEGVGGQAFGDNVFNEIKRQSMYGEDFAFYGIDPAIPATYFAIGGTKSEDLVAAASGGPPVAPHHSPLFKIEPEDSISFGVEATVIALRELLQE